MSDLALSNVGLLLLLLSERDAKVLCNTQEGDEAELEPAPALDCNAKISPNGPPIWVWSMSSSGIDSVRDEIEKFAWFSLDVVALASEAKSFFR